MKRLLLSFTLMVAAISLPEMSRAEIDLDYSGDTYFSQNAPPEAQAALEAAAADINAAIDFSNLSAITDDTISGSSGDKNVSFNFLQTYFNPADGNLVDVPNTEIAAGQVNIFAGGRVLSGNTLGQGGPAGSGLSPSGTNGGPGGTFAQAIADAEANEQHSRGGAPIIGTLSGSIGGANYSFDQGLHTGSIVFDADTNWHFDHTAPVAAGRSDFYTVALHELLHALSFGIGDSWDALVSGTDYLGAEGIAANGGSGEDLVFSGGGHLAENVMSVRISDGVMQEVLMDPNITVGTRKGLTELDLAVMRDLGFITVSAIPEPSSFAFVLAGSVMIGFKRRRSALTV